MDEKNIDRQGIETGEKQPVFNVPSIIFILFGSFVLVQMLRTFVSKEWDDWLILNFAFTPARLSPPPEVVGIVFPGGVLGDMWTFVTHAFLHGDWEHLVFNSIWMFVFGSVIARRLRSLRFLLFSAYAAAFGAVGHYLYNHGSLTFLVGASGAISGMMGGAVRLMYSADGGLSHLRRGNFGQVALMPLKKIVRHRSAMMFVLVWLVLNLVFGLTGFGTSGGVSRIAWEAHLGGFLSGFLLFELFDPISKKRSLFSRSQ